MGEQVKYIRDLYQDIPCRHSEKTVCKKEYMLEMPDGVHLRTVFWKPENGSDFSVIVTRTCYPHQEPEFDVHAEEYARRGYGFVVQWCRGINGSEGKWEPNTHERQDGLTLMNWLASQDDVKNIGYWGNSYLASTGWCMADAVPEKVKSMYLGVYGTDRYTSVYQDGLFRQDIFTWWSMDNAGVPVAADYLESCRYRPQVEVDEAMWGIRLDWYRDWISNTDRDSDYWSRKGFWKMMSEIPEKMKIPVFIREGWYDHHLGSAVVSWNRLSEMSKAGSTIQIGPWRHAYDYVLTGQPTENLTDDSVSSPYYWFEKTLLQEEVPKRSCQLYMIGADQWITLEDLPQTGQNSMVLHLDAGQIKDSAGRLTVGKETGAEISYVYDPENPVPSHGTESCFKSVKEIGSLKQPECGYRDDVISFVSEPLEHSLDIAGTLEVLLHVSSDAEDTAFTAKIMEIFEDGTCVNIRGNITTLAYRNGAADRQTYEPGQIEKICIRMWPIAWRIRAGSRIRLDISSSDFPQYAVHSNYPGIWSMQEKSRTAVQTVYTGEAFDSCLRIPIMK